MSKVPRVIVVGSINSDLCLRVRRLPVAGETVSARNARRYPGGKGANQATAAARLGCDSILIAAVGLDDAGTAIVEELSALGVDTSRIQHVEEATGQAVVVVGDDGENQIVVVAGANSSLGADHVASSLAQILVPGDVVLANLEVSDACVFAAASVARDAGALFVLNPAPARPLAPELLAACDAITPNQREAQALGPLPVDELRASVKGAVIVTMGANGAVLYEPDQKPLMQPPFPVRVVDTTGAGDAFSAAFACSIARGSAVTDALGYASAAAALSTRIPGASGGMPTDDEVCRLMDEHREVRRHQLEAAL